MTPLCDIALRYRTDKCPQLGHSYTPFYWELFKDRRESVKKVLEMGIGSHASMDRCVSNYTVGASLYMWRDFFPNAQIYGADFDPMALFEAERIKTFLCDSTKREEIENLVRQTGSDIDLFIDDGTHNVNKQAFLCKTIMPLLKKDVIYIIEDVFAVRSITRLMGGYEIEVPRFVTENKHTGYRHYRDCLIIVRNKV